MNAPQQSLVGGQDEVLAWLITYRLGGEKKRAVHLTNAIGDYRRIDPFATVEELAPVTRHAQAATSQAAAQPNEKEIALAYRAWLSEPVDYDAFGAPITRKETLQVSGGEYQIAYAFAEGYKAKAKANAAITSADHIKLPQTASEAEAMFRLANFWLSTNAPDVLAMLAPQAAAPGVQGWQPIETAPKDGWLLLFDAAENVTVVGRWGKHNHCPLYGWIRPVELYGEEVDGFEATHWMPLPAPPLPESQPEPGEGEAK